MNALGEAGGGFILALSFALLLQRRLHGMLIVLGLQCATVAMMAAQQAIWPVAGLELAWCALGLPWLLSRAEQAAAWAAPAPATLAAATALATVCLPLGASGTGLAVVLLGALLMAQWSRPAVLIVALGSLQAGAVAAGLATGARMILLAAPCLPTLGLVLYGGLDATPQFRDRPGRRSFARFAHELREADFIGCLLLLLAACVLPRFADAVPGPWKFDAPGVLALMLLSLSASTLRWPNGPIRAAPFGSLLIPGAAVALLAANPILAWIGLAGATAVALRPQQRRMAGIGLGVSLFGSLTLHAATLPACVTLLVGLGCLAMLGPDLAILAAVFLLPLRAELGPVAGLDSLLMTAGLLAVLLAVSVRHPRLNVLATLGQAGVVMFALGLDVPMARLAAVLQLVLLVLSRLALELAPEDGLLGMAVLLGLFPGFTLVLGATAADRPLLLLPLGSGLAALAWRMLRGLPAAPYKLRPSIAWLPLTAALLIGFVLPTPMATGLRMVAEHLW